MTHIRFLHRLRTARLSPLSRALLALWLVIVWGTVIITGCSEDCILNPTLSNATLSSTAATSPAEPAAASTAHHGDATVVPEAAAVEPRAMPVPDDIMLWN